MARTLLVAAFIAVLVACGSNNDTPAQGAAAPATEVDRGGPPWAAFQDQGALFVKAGRASGLVMDSAVTVLGAPVAGTTNRRIIGFGNVAEVWDDMVRVDTTHLDPGAVGQGMVARRPEKSDLAVVTNLPKK